MAGSNPATLAVRGVSKSFGTTRAVTDATLELRAGEVHCIVGENGSGKSTLVKILAGVQRPDSGVLEIAGREHDHLPNPRAAADEGISVVFQETLVVEPRSVFDNIWLGTDGVVRRKGSTRARREKAEAILAELLDSPPDLDEPIEALSLSVRQACCVARGLVREPQTLILDEATSSLDVSTRDRLFGLIRRRALEGASVIFISHRMDEIGSIGDRCTVMRSGETVATVDGDEASPEALIRLMTGSQQLVGADSRESAVRAAPGDVVIAAEGISLRPYHPGFDFELRAGELVGVAGLEGHGQDEFIDALRGAAGYGGEVARLAGDSRTVLDSPETAAANGVVHVPRERRAESMLESKSIRENFGLATLSRDVRRGLLRPSLTRRRLEGFAEQLSIVYSSTEDLITTLSGGNQQKVVIARWLAAEPDVLLLKDPTRGVDIGAKRELYELLAQLVQRSVAVVMLSTEVDEHIELMDRVLVFREHRLSAELPRAGLSRERLTAAFFAQEGTVGARERTDEG